MEPISAITRHFHVCGKCYEIHGPFVWRLQGVDYSHTQECACTRNRRAVDERGEKWPGFDFNTVAELCQACGCQALRSGSRYSVWFCGDCQERARTLNAEVGQALIPIGRHTIMNGFGLQAAPKPTDGEIAAFVARCGTMVERIHRLAEWGQAVVHRNLVTIGWGDADNVALAEYLAEVRGIDRDDRFDAMVASTTLAERDS